MKPSGIVAFQNRVRFCWFSHSGFVTILSWDSRIPSQTRMPWWQNRCLAKLLQLIEALSPLSLHVFRVYRWFSDREFGSIDKSKPEGQMLEFLGFHWKSASAFETGLSACFSIRRWLATCDGIPWGSRCCWFGSAAKRKHKCQVGSHETRGRVRVYWVVCSEV